MSNTFGKIFKLTSFGESYGSKIGGIIDGCPSGLKLDIQNIQSELDRRKPWQNKITTQRNESDSVEIISGVFEGITTGAPIGFTISNNNSQSKDYDNIKNHVKAITPVPGGVGPMTIACLLQNTLACFKKSNY